MFISDTCSSGLSRGKDLESVDVSAEAGGLIAVKKDESNTAGLEAVVEEDGCGMLPRKTGARETPPPPLLDAETVSPY